MRLSKNLSNNLINFGLKPEVVFNIVQQAISEDLADSIDITSESIIPENQISSAEFVVRKDGVIAGLNITAAVLESVGISDYEILIPEGSQVGKNTPVIRVTGNTRKILLAERTALNFLGKLSGISTLTNKWVLQVQGTKTKIRDTRKTTPLLREFEKFAVRMGGGENHRMSLSDAALIKDNHIAAAGSITKAFQAIKEKHPETSIEIEVDSLEQLNEAIEVGAELVLLDNMSIETCRAAVTQVAGRCKLEASGGLTIESANAYAKTGVDYLAVGALTHSAPVLDIGLDFKEK